MAVGRLVGPLASRRAIAFGVERRVHSTSKCNSLGWGLRRVSPSVKSTRHRGVDSHAASFAAMNGARKTRKSVPISETVAVNTREVNVAIEGVDRIGIAGSFTVHLIKNRERIASRFFFQPSDGMEAVEAGGENQFARFDFLLPIEVVAG